MPWLINASQVDQFRKKQKNVVILDATWHAPQEQRNAYQEFLDHHIVDARFFDLNLFHEQQPLLLNMVLRDEHRISSQLTALGISNEHKVILYDNSQLHTSCRAFWMLKVFGHSLHQLYILDGGMTAWGKYGGKIVSGPVQKKNPSSKLYAVNFAAQHVRTLIQMKANLHHSLEQVIDLRNPIRYAGGGERLLGLRTGHIPGSFSFPYFTMFDQSGYWKPVEKIVKQLLAIGIDLKSPLVTLCGSGITATILNFVLDILEHRDHALYDGSWSEWGAQMLYTGEQELSERPVVSSLDT